MPPSKTVPQLVCPTCGSTDPVHRQDEEHGFIVASGEGLPLALTIDLQERYNSSSGKARALSRALSEMKKYFLGKEFMLLPSRLMVTKEGENSVLHGEAHVAAYIAIER